MGFFLSSLASELKKNPIWYWALLYYNVLFAPYFLGPHTSHHSSQSYLIITVLMVIQHILFSFNQGPTQRWILRGHGRPDLVLHCFKQGEGCGRIRCLNPTQRSQVLWFKAMSYFVVWRLSLVVGPYLREHRFWQYGGLLSTNVPRERFRLLALVQFNIFIFQLDITDSIQSS